MACGRTGRVEAGKREIKRQLQLADGIMKEDLYMIDFVLWQG